MGSPKTIASTEVAAALERLATAIAERHQGGPAVWLLGVADGGIVLARRLEQRLRVRGLRVTAGTIDISFHRDDFGRRPIPKEFLPTQIPGDVTGATVILVDDVLFTGRSVKAAMDELFDHGRPARVELAVLVDRGGRTLPIAADYAGLRVTAGPKEKVEVALDANDPQRDVIRMARAVSA